MEVYRSTVLTSDDTEPEVQDEFPDVCIVICEHTEPPVHV